MQIFITSIDQWKNIHDRFVNVIPRIATSNVVNDTNMLPQFVSDLQPLSGAIGSMFNRSPLRENPISQVDSVIPHTISLGTTKVI